MTTVDAQTRRRTFCAELKTQRERRGIPLKAIADSTKIKASLLEALERADVSRWPKGLYRRAFLRDYLTAIGLPAEPSVTEFTDLFPDGEERPSAAPATPPSPPLPPTALRLTFEGTDPRPWAARLGIGQSAHLVTIGRRAAAAGVDLALVAGLTALASFLLQSELWSTATIVAAAWFSLSTALAGRSFASAWLGRQSWAGGSNEDARDTEAASSPRSRRDRGFSPIRISGGSAALRTYWTATSRFLPGRQGPLPRDLAAVRRRRVDQANRTNDEIEAIG